MYLLEVRLNYSLIRVSDLEQLMSSKWQGTEKVKCIRSSLPLRMRHRPSPFESHCVVILNCKNSVCILSRIVPLSFSPLPLPRRSHSSHPRCMFVFTSLFPSAPSLNSSLFVAARCARAATECIVYAAIRETYCLPANNERFPREISAVFISPQARSLRSNRVLRQSSSGILCELFRRNLRMLFPLQSGIATIACEREISGMMDVRNNVLMLSFVSGWAAILSGYIQELLLLYLSPNSKEINKSIHGT